MSTVIDIVLGAFLCVLLAVAAYLAVFRYRSASHKGSRKKGDEPKPAKEPAKSQEKHSGGHGSKGSFPLGKVVLWLAGILLFLLVLWYAIPILAWIINLLLHTMFGDRIVQPARVPPPQVVATSPLNVDPERQRIESQSYSISLDDCDCSMPEWVPIPDGYEVRYSTTGVPGTDPSIGAQCSSANEKPSQGASGEEYWCHLAPDGGIVGKWFRPYIYRHAESSAVFNYHFRHL